MVVTLLGIVTDVSPVHPLKEFLPINLTPLGILIEVRLVQPSKTPLS